MCGNSIILSSSAHAICATVEKMKPKSVVPRVYFAFCRSRGGTFRSVVKQRAADEDDREDYQEEDLHCTKERASWRSLDEPSSTFVKRAIKSGKEIGDWNVVGEAAYAW